MTFLHEQGETITIRVGETPCTLKLGHLYRRCEGFPAHAMTFLRQAALAVLHVIEAADDLPADWRQRVMPLLVSPDAEIPAEVITRPVCASLLLGYALDNGESFRWVTREELAQTGSYEEELHQLAVRNLERSCNALVVESPETLPNSPDHIIHFHTHDGLDAARVLIPSFFQRFSPRFGDDDLLVAIPTRDILLMVAAHDQEQANMLAWSAREEHRRGAYPIQAGLLRVTATGIAPASPRTDITIQKKTEE